MDIEEGIVFVKKKLERSDIVNISWHIFLKDITDYAAISKAS